MFFTFVKHTLENDDLIISWPSMVECCQYVITFGTPSVSHIKSPDFSQLCINLFFYHLLILLHITKMTSTAGTRPPITVTNKVSEFLLDPWSTVKVVVPSAAVQVLIHQTCLKKASLRELTLGLTLLNAIWFATTLNMSYIETPLLANVPSLDDSQKLDVGRHRFNWINKIEVRVLFLFA